MVPAQYGPCHALLTWHMLSHVHPCEKLSPAATSQHAAETTFLRQVAQTCQLALQRIDYHTRRALRARQKANPESQPGPTASQDSLDTAAAPLCSDATNAKAAQPAGRQLQSDFESIPRSSCEPTACPDLAAQNAHNLVSAGNGHPESLSSVAVQLDPLDEVRHPSCTIMSAASSS